MAMWDVDEVPASTLSASPASPASPLSPHSHSLHEQVPALILLPLTIQVPALGAPPSALPTADELRVPPSLKSLLRALPNRTAGLLVPRLQFDCNGLDTPAPPPLLEYEAFTRRSCAPG